MVDNKLKETFRLHEGDTGSSEVQVIRLTERIEQLTEHAQTHKKDNSSKRGLRKLVSQRRKMLDYVKKHKIEVYKSLVQALGLRK